MSGSVPFDFDALLAHAEWVQRLTRQLCRDQHDAADAVQETWLRMLRQPPKDLGAARGFLASVLRNVVYMRGRAELRAGQLEQAAARDELVESAADAASRVDLQQFVVREVMALPEPQRALVLLHYFEGRSVATLAIGMTADAVRAHLRRVRDTLRLRLQSSDGPARRAFGGLLLANATSVPWVILGATMATLMKTKLVAAAAAVTIAAWAFWQFDGPNAQPTTSTDLTASAPVAAVPTAAGTAANTVEAVQRTAAVVAGTAAAGPVVRCHLTGLRAEAPWTAEVELHLENAAGTTALLRAMPEAGGPFSFALPTWTAHGEFTARLIADDPNYLEVEATERVTDFATSRLAVDSYAIRVEPVATCVGTVVDFRGAPVPAARVTAFAWRGNRPREPRFAANTAADGTFVLKVPIATELLVVAVAMRPAGNEPRRLGAHGAIPDCGEVRDDLQLATVRTFVAFGTRTEVPLLTLPQPAMITGELRDPQGRPVAGEFVLWWPDGTDLSFPIDRRVNVAGNWPDLMLTPDVETDARGHFRLPARAGVAGVIFLRDRFQRYEPFVDRRRVTAPADLTIQLGGNTALLRVVRAGAPVPHVVVTYDGSDQAGTPLATDERGELRLLREHAKVQRLSLRPQGRPPLAVELPLDTAPDRPIVVEIGDVPLAPIVFDVTSAFPVQQFSIGFSLIGSKVGGASFGLVRDAASGEFRCDSGLSAGEYVLLVCRSLQAEGNDRFVLRHGLRGQRVLVTASGARVPLAIVHGGLIRVQVHYRDGAGRRRRLAGGTRWEELQAWIHAGER